MNVTEVPYNTLVKSIVTGEVALIVPSPQFEIVTEYNGLHIACNVKD